MTFPRTLTVLAWAVLAVGCSGCAIKSGVTAKGEVGPETSRMVYLAGRWSTASGCPVSARKVLTAAHVIDPKPFDKDAPLMRFSFSQGATVGFANPEYSEARRDIGVVTVDRDVEFYPIAKEAPKAGDTLYFSGYDWTSVKKAYAPRTWEVKTLRSVAGGLLIYDPAGEPGTSGSCVLNSAGEVVAINVGGRSVGRRFESEVGLGVLVVGEEF